MTECLSSLHVVTLFTCGFELDAVYEQCRPKSNNLQLTREKTLSDLILQCSSETEHLADTNITALYTLLFKHYPSLQLPAFSEVDC